MVNSKFFFDLADQAKIYKLPETLEYLPEAGTGALEAGLYYRFLALLAKELKARLFVELGTYLGSASCIVASLNPECKVYTVDKNFRSQPARYSVEYSNYYYLANDDLKQSVIDSIPDDIDILFIDSSHEYLQTKREYEAYRGKMNSTGIICWDDINYNNDMRRFWQELKENKIELNELHYQGFGVSWI